jgi:hypothetical protein
MIDPLAALSLGLAAGAGAGAAAARWRKAKPEAEALAIETLRTVLGELRAELEAKNRELSELRQRVRVAEVALEAVARDKVKTE